jgi:hypothetical protein
MVADDAQGKADQDRCEGRLSRTLRRLADGGGGHSARPVRGHLEDDRGTSAAASRINGIVRSGVAGSIENDGRSASQ